MVLPLFSDHLTKAMTLSKVSDSRDSHRFGLEVASA